MKRHLDWASAVSLLAILPVFSSAAHAQAPEPEQGARVTSDDAIVVTARRRAEDISTIPIAISAFSGETLERKSVLSTADLVKVTPGLNITGAGSTTNPFVTIRGQSKGLAGPGTPGVLSYFNEVPLPTYGSLIPTYDMDNIQVLKGPQGTLFGRNAIGGAVLTYSRRPAYELSGYGQVEYGRFNNLRIEGAINLPIIADVLAVRIAGQSTGIDGFTKTDVYSPFQYVPDATSLLGVRAVPGVKLSNQRQYDEIDSRSVRASILFEPTDWIHNTTVLDYTKVRGANNVVFTGTNPLNPNPLFTVPVSFLPEAIRPIIGPLFQCGTSVNCDYNLALAARSRGLRAASTDEPADATSVVKGISNTTTLDFSDSVTLKNIFAYRTTSSAQTNEIDGTAMPIVNTANLVRLKQVTNELQLSGQFLDNRLKYVVGGFYFKSSPNGLGGFQALHVTVFGGLNDEQTVNYLTEESKAVYGQVDFEVIPDVTATAGYRQTWDEASGCAYSAVYSVTSGGQPPTAGTQAPIPSESECKAGSFLDPRAAPNTTVSYVPGASKFKKGTYTLALNWQVNDDLLLYATTRRGYRSGGFNVPKLPAIIDDLQNFAPETLTDYEIGTKGHYEFGAVRGTFNLAGFLGKDKGYQYYQTTTGVSYVDPATGETASLPTGGVLINKANLEISGFEGELTISPVEGMNFGSNVAYTKIKVDDVTIPASLLAAYTLAGQESTLGIISVPNQPKWQYNVYADFNIGQVAGGDLRFNADLHHQSKYRSGELDVPSWTTLDARLTLANLYDGAVDLSIYGRNILDETYFAGTGSSSSGIGAVSYIVAPPATYGVTARYRFGG